MTIYEFISRHEITITWVHRDAPTPGQRWSSNKYWFDCTIRRPGAEPFQTTQYIFIYTSLHSPLPLAPVILSFLAGTAHWIDIARNYRHWLTLMGNMDSARSFRDYKRADREQVELHLFLGSQRYVELLRIFYSSPDMPF